MFNILGSTRFFSNESFWFNRKGLFLPAEVICFPFGRHTHASTDSLKSNRRSEISILGVSLINRAMSRFGISFLVMFLWPAFSDRGEGRESGHESEMVD
jgi:hypothetical protein